jgi:glucosamine--fructose-6-phosphate aminotransferase (isomerizing)
MIQTLSHFSEVGMSLRDEIFEQPAAIRRLLEMQDETAREIAARIGDQDVSFVYLAARGTSDNAGLYAKYLWGIHNGFPVALAAPSMFSVFKKPPRIGDSLVVGISQSGQSPDIVSVAEAAELVIDTVAGPEQAVAATKTYTTQLTAIAMLSVALARDAEQREWLGRLPSLVEDALKLDETIKEAAARYRYMTECVVLGRGYNYATAHEWSLKLKELAYVVAEPYSSADFQHGPVALARQGFPVFAVVPGGTIDQEIIKLLTELVQDEQVELLAISSEGSALALANTPVQLPERLPEWITPIPAIVPAQLFCYHLTRAKGYNTEGPRGLSKVTLTW